VSVIFDSTQSSSTFARSSVLRRAVLVSLVVLLGREQLSTFTWVTVCNTSFLMAHMFFRPYSRILDNHSETMDLGVLTVISTLLTSEALPLSATPSLVMGILVFVPAGILFAMIIRSRLLQLQRHFKRRRETKGASRDFADGVERDRNESNMSRPSSNSAVSVDGHDDEDVEMSKMPKAEQEQQQQQQDPLDRKQRGDDAAVSDLHKSKGKLSPLEMLQMHSDSVAAQSTEGQS